MRYTIMKQWKTLDGTYYSSTVNKSNYDLAVGEFHSMFKPMLNDTNVAYFRLSLIDETGFEHEFSRWKRGEHDYENEQE